MRFLVFCLFSIWSTVSLADIPRPETLDDTLELLLDGAHRAGFSEAVIDREDRSVDTDPTSENSFLLYPDNLHRSLLSAADDAERQGILDDFLAPILSGEFWSEAFSAQKVMPILRHDDYLRAVRSESTLPHRPFAGDMIVTYVQDFQTHTGSITEESMAEEGFDLLSLHDLALENLYRLGENLTIEGGDVGIYFLTLDGYYESSMLLDDALWDNVVEQIGPIAVAVPTRDFVMIAPREQDALVARIAEIRDESLRDSPYPLSELLFTWADGRWKVLAE